jgi:hypothetical protein
LGAFPFGGTHPTFADGSLDNVAGQLGFAAGSLDNVAGQLGFAAGQLGFAAGQLGFAAGLKPSRYIFANNL